MDVSSAVFCALLYSVSLSVFRVFSSRVLHQSKRDFELRLVVFGFFRPHGGFVSNCVFSF